jgi:hypothetical protein
MGKGLKRKTDPVRIRITPNLKLKIAELSKLTNSSVSAITRAAVIKYMQYNQDEEGNWILPDKTNKK